MIKDRIENADSYYKISEKLKQGFEWLQSTDLNNLQDGKYLINGETVFANVQSYETKENAPYEAHRKYLDIQYMIDGKERVGVVNYSDCSMLEEYNVEKDIEFLHSKITDKFQTIETGEFLVLFPQDAHKPSIQIENKDIVKKVVVKVEL